MRVGISYNKRKLLQSLIARRRFKEELAEYQRSVDTKKMILSIHMKSSQIEKEQRIGFYQEHLQDSSFAKDSPVNSHIVITNQKV
ncbi:hypothetical protein KAX97_05120 [candidate division WOR-3 bacterium]|nr:hypothetical protein [candidate division WOR-3 bacterium]